MTHSWGAWQEWHKTRKVGIQTAFSFLPSNDQKLPPQSSHRNISSLKLQTLHSKENVPVPNLWCSLASLRELDCYLVEVDTKRYFMIRTVGNHNRGMQQPPEVLPSTFKAIY